MIFACILIPILASIIFCFITFIHGMESQVANHIYHRKDEYISLAERDYDVLIAKAEAFEDAASLVDADDACETENSRMLSEKAAALKKLAEGAKG